MNIINKLTYENFFYFNNNLIEIEIIIKQANDRNFLQSLKGQFAVIIDFKEEILLFRDPLGINKLFYYVNNSKLIVSNKIHDLVNEGINIDDILSVPSNAVVRINKDNFEKKIDYLESNKVEALTFDLNSFVATNKNLIDNYILSFYKKFPRHNYIVCLSGGLDSSILAYRLSKIIPKNQLSFCSFSFKAVDFENTKWVEYLSSTSEDFQTAFKISQEIDINFIPLLCEKTEVARVIEDCVLLSQDWRDFNVHCAVVNYLIGFNLKKVVSPDNTLILTGDLMNEFVADYTPVEFKNEVYYQLPKISRYKLIKFLTLGLDTSDREIGVFNHFNFKTIQPYSVLVSQYLNLDEKIINDNINLKEFLNIELFENNDFLKKIVSTKKIRAQVGGKEGGVLGICHNYKITQNSLKEIWKNKMASGSRTENYFGIIQMGKYKV